MRRGRKTRVRSTRRDHQPATRGWSLHVPGNDSLESKQTSLYVLRTFRSGDPNDAFRTTPSQEVCTMYSSSKLLNGDQSSNRDAKASHNAI